jgi:peptide chain release factor 3
MNKRCTFAIISHPDAGKTTITEKLLWFGQIVRKTGMVKSKVGNFAKSDWMELEKQRGISITSSVISFEYEQRYVHLLDTPGHQDFSEDTYRTLTAVESVLMMIDSAKGVETQTVKLMDVCRLRDTPIVTFMNKFDRESLDPFALLDNIEKILNIQCVPLTWPIGSGVEFKGVYDLEKQQIMSFKGADDPFSPIIIKAENLEHNQEVIDFIGQELHEKLLQDLDMLKQLVPPLQIAEYLAGIQTPVFFGSALRNFGVKETLDFITTHAPGPKDHEALCPPYDSHSAKVTIGVNETEFSGFIFKIQANMDKNHRDRISFLRVCSGTFKRNQKLFHVRSEKDIKISNPLIFQAQDRDIVEEAYPGDVIGLYDNGKYQIGDTFTQGRKILFTGIPNFAPEIFKKIILKDPLKAKHLLKGLQHLSEEGAIQLFMPHKGYEKILGAVGNLQFEVVKFRLEDEYQVHGEFISIPVIGIRWIKCADEKIYQHFVDKYQSAIVFDIKQRPCLAYQSEWDLRMIKEKNPEIKFYKNSDFKDS